MPEQVAVVPAQTPFGLQNIAGGVSISSINPSQSSSRPLQTSAPAKLHAYSQPLEGLPSRLKNPGRHIPSVQTLALQIAVAFGNVQTRPHIPQLLGSLESMKPSSVIPSQSLSRESHTSVAGPVEPVQTRVPPRQVWLPATHSPVPVPQAAPP